MELPLDVGQLLKHLAGRPQQHLDDETNEAVNASNEPFTLSLKIIRSVSERSHDGHPQLDPPHLSPPGLTVVQVAQVENSQQQVGKVQIFI